MDISFDIHNDKGDQIRVALSYYDTEMELTPQEYRSRLFSRMFDMYVKANGISDIINYSIKIEDNNTPRFAHFITPEKYLPAVKLLGNIIMEK